MALSPSRIDTVAAANVGTSPLVTADPMIRPGTKMLFDFTDQFGTNPYADGAIATASTFQDLKDTPVVATVSTTGLSNAAGKTGLVSNGTAGGITFGTAGQCAVPVGNELLVTMSLKQSAANGTYRALAWCGPAGATTGNACQWFIDMGADGRTPRLQIGTGASVHNATQAQLVDEAVTHIALYFNPSTGAFRTYRDGALVSTASVGAMNIQDGSTQLVYFDTRFIGTLYRFAVHDLTQSIADETALAGMPAASILNADAHALREVQFATNALALAPRVPFT